MPRTIIEKLWDSHVVHEQPGAPTLLFIDLHLVHEVTSPQAFQGLRERGLKVRRPDLTIATADHSIPTTDRSLPIVDQIAAKQLDATGSQLRRVRHSLPGRPQRAAGHRPRHRAGTRTHAARHDRGLRRQPHRHPRSVRRAGFRHRHQRSGARAGHASACCSASRRPSRCAWMARSNPASPPRTSSSR